MKCPVCGQVASKVVDSRLSKDARTIRRRRECEACGRRFTTYEKWEESLPLVVKKDGRREAFSRAKIVGGIRKSCQKRPVSMNRIEEFVDTLESYFQDLGRPEVSSRDIGELVIEKLKQWDEVAYVRFASVYRQFKDINAFMEELREILKSKETDGDGAA